MLMSCVIPCWILSRKAEAFALVTLCSSLLPCRHPLCMHLQGFGSQGCKEVSEVVLTVRCDADEEESVFQGMSLKDGERVVCVFQVPVIDGQADGWSSSCQCTGNGVSCGLGRLSEMSCCGVGSEAMFQILDGQIVVRSARQEG